MIQISSKRKDGIWFSMAQSEAGKLIACSFSDRNRHEAESAVKQTLRGKPAVIEEGQGTGTVGFREIYGMFKGQRVTVNMNLVDLSNVFPFQRKVYSLLRRIPRGKVTTYGGLAARLGGRRYARAVGTAVGSNPLPLIIPCHRVVPASLSVGNYGMPGRHPSEGGYMKRRLLELEGVKFLGGKVSKESLWYPS